MRKRVKQREFASASVTVKSKTTEVATVKSILEFTGVYACEGRRLDSV